MKNLLKSILIIAFVVINVSCKKDDLPELESNCYVCTASMESIDVCLQENGDFLVNGDVVPNPNNATLSEYITAIEANPNNDPALEGISCTRK